MGTIEEHKESFKFKEIIRKDKKLEKAIVYLRGLIIGDKEINGMTSGLFGSQEIPWVKFKNHKKIFMHLFPNRRMGKDGEIIDESYYLYSLTPSIELLSKLTYNLGEILLSAEVKPTIWNRLTGRYK